MCRLLIPNTRCASDFLRYTRRRFLAALITVASGLQLSRERWSAAAAFCTHCDLEEAKMRSLGLRFVVALSCGLFAFAAAAAFAAENHHIIYTPTKDAIVAKAGNLSNHGGPVIVSAKVVYIFWGPSFANVASPDHAYALTLQAFRNQFGTTGEYNTITQYCGSNGCVQLTNLASGTADLFDTSTPPTRVTDSIVQSEVNSYLSSHGGNNTSTIYEVVIPSSSYSDDGTGTVSCGGPDVHSW